MIRYLAKQAVSSFIALFLFLTFMFFYAEIIIAHDYTVQFAMIYNRQQIQEELGPIVLWSMLPRRGPKDCPLIALSLFAAAFYLVARGMHEVADPRLRKLS